MNLEKINEIINYYYIYEFESLFSDLYLFLSFLYCESQFDQFAFRYEKNYRYLTEINKKRYDDGILKTSVGLSQIIFNNILDLERKYKVINETNILEKYLNSINFQLHFTRLFFYKCKSYSIKENLFFWNTGTVKETKAGNKYFNRIIKTKNYISSILKIKEY